MGDILDPSVLWRNNPSGTTAEQAKSPAYMIEDLIKIVKFQVKEVNEYLDSFKSQEQSSDAKNVVDLLRVLEKLLQNLEFSEGIIKCKSDGEIKSVKDKFSSLKSDYNQLQSKQDLNLTILAFTIDYLRNVLLEEFVVRMDECFKRDKESKYCFQKSWINSAWIQIMTFRLEAIVENYHRALLYNKSDLFSFPKNAQVWQDLYKVTTFKEVLPEEELEAISKSFYALIFIVFSIVKERSDASPNPDFSGTFGLLRDVIRFKRDPATSEALAWHYLRDPTVTCFRLSLIQNPLARRIRNFKLPSIEENQIVYLPRIFPQITKDLILKEYQNKTINRFSLPEDQIVCKVEEQKLEDLFVPDPEKIQVRIVSSEPLNIGEKGILSWFKKANTSKVDSKAIVIHVHGGGWARGASELYLNNLIPWTKTLKSVFFSIDYRLAPQNPYPCGLDDVWQSYLWILHYSENVLGIKFEKVILVGDSAGGNLISALTLRLIKTGLRVPDGLFMIYPSFDLKMDICRPSFLKSLHNPVLPVGLLKLFVDSYVGKEFRLSEDPFISPLVACDKLLEKMPPSRIVVGTEDPIEDDSWRFMSRLIKLNRNVKTIVYKGLPHGYYSAGATKFTDEITKDGADIIQELINL